MAGLGAMRVGARLSGKVGRMCSDAGGRTSQGAGRSSAVNSVTAELSPAAGVPTGNSWRAPSTIDTGAATKAASSRGGRREKDIMRGVFAPAPPGV